MTLPSFVEADSKLVAAGVKFQEAEEARRRLGKTSYPGDETVDDIVVSIEKCTDLVIALRAQSLCGIRAKATVLQSRLIEHLQPYGPNEPRFDGDPHERLALSLVADLLQESEA